MNHNPLSDRISLVDTHCHLDLYNDPAQILTETDKRSVYTIAVTNAPSVFQHTATLTANSRFVRAAVGLHPELVRSHAHELNLLYKYLPDTRYVGEVGLDYTTSDEDARRAQREVFKQLLDRCASFGNKVLTVHSRRSAADVISFIGSGYPGKVILHWFSGNKRECEKALEYGLYFSINPAMIRSAKGRGIVELIPQDRILTETDGPFVKLGSQPANPWDVIDVVEPLAGIWQKEVSATRERILENFRRLLGWGLIFSEI